MEKRIRLAWLRFRYGYEMVQAYIAEGIGEEDVKYNHLYNADMIQSQYWREQINEY